MAILNVSDLACSLEHLEEKRGEMVANFLNLKAQAEKYKGNCELQLKAYDAYDKIQVYDILIAGLKAKKINNVCYDNISELL